MTTTTPTQLHDLHVGDLISVDLIINKADSDPSATSGTAQKIKNGKPVRRVCIVLRPGQHSVQVTYLATFNYSTSLPTWVTDKTMWYPIQPALKQGTLDPLPPLSNNVAQWACLRARHTITQNPVPKFNSLTIAQAQQSGNHIDGHMKA